MKVLLLLPEPVSGGRSFHRGPDFEEMNERCVGFCIFVLVVFAFFSLYPLVLVLAFYPFALGFLVPPHFFYHTRWGLLDNFLFRFGTGILQGEKGKERDCSRWRRRRWI